MNLLITNTLEDQAYLILRCLRHEAKRIVITVNEGNLVERWANISAWSRHVHKRYSVPDCSADWRSGRIQAANTPAEEAYIRRIEDICAMENIDTIFPSYDAEVFVFSKNKERFARRGIITVVAGYEALTRILDKELTLEAARAVGFPIPSTHVPSNRDELLAAAARLPSPWVLKPRCNAHGANIRRAQDLPELERAFSELSAVQQRPLLQEFVPVQTKRNYYLLVNPELEVVSLFSPVVYRFRRVGIRTPCAAVATTTDVPCVAEVRALVKRLGIWGGMTVQTIVDARDGTPRLMEINPRFGHNLWYRTEFGINEPLIFLRLARGEAVGEIPSFPEGVLLLDPLWDLLHLLGRCLSRGKAWLRGRFRGSNAGEEPFPEESIGDLLRELRSEYFSRRLRITSPLNRGYLSDPLPPVVRFARVMVQAIRIRAA